MNLRKGRKKTMNDENIAIVLNALADKIRMQEWEIRSQQKRIEELTDKLAAVSTEETKKIEVIPF